MLCTTHHSPLTFSFNRLFEVLLRTEKCCDDGLFRHAVLASLDETAQAVGVGGPMQVLLVEVLHQELVRFRGSQEYRGQRTSGNVRRLSQYPRLDFARPS